MVLYSTECGDLISENIKDIEGIEEVICIKNGFCHSWHKDMPLELQPKSLLKMYPGSIYFVKSSKGIEKFTYGGKNILLGDC